MTLSRIWQRETLEWPPVCSLWFDDAKVSHSRSLSIKTSILRTRSFSLAETESRKVVFDLSSHSRQRRWEIWAELNVQQIVRESIHRRVAITGGL